jgi:glucose/arabinose dehydrogenase
MTEKGFKMIKIFGLTLSAVLLLGAGGLAQAQVAEDAAAATPAATTRGAAATAQPTPTPVPTATAVTNVATGAAATAATAEMPVSGTVEATLAIFAVGAVLLFLGGRSALSKR